MSLVKVKNGQRRCVSEQITEAFPWNGEQHLRQVPQAYSSYYNTARTHRSLESLAPERAACSGSNLKLDPYFHDLRARNLEVCTGPLCVMMHEGE
jgi:hypothetical protein